MLRIMDKFLIRKSIIRECGLSIMYLLVKLALILSVVMPPMEKVFS